MPLRGIRRRISIPRIDSVDYRLVFGDQPRHGTGMAQLRIGYPIHIGLDVRNGVPGEPTTDTLRDRNVELFVFPAEGVVVSSIICRFLAIKDRFDLATQTRSEAPT